MTSCFAGFTLQSITLNVCKNLVVRLQLVCVATAYPCGSAMKDVSFRLVIFAYMFVRACKCFPFELILEDWLHDAFEHALSSGSINPVWGFVRSLTFDSVSIQ